MSRSTRSQRRGTTLSVNTLVSSTEQGNDSMASNIDDDTNGSIAEAGGHNILSIRVAYFGAEVPKLVGPKALLKPSAGTS